MNFGNSLGGEMKSNSFGRWIWSSIMAAFLLVVLAGIFLLPSGTPKTQFNQLILIIAVVYAAYILFAIYESGKEENNPFGENQIKALLIMISVTIVGITFRVIIGLAVPGYAADMSCWTAWSQAAAGSNLFNVYESTSFLDYPPGYLYILHIIGTLGNLLSIECATPAYNLLLKIPSIIADLGMSWVLYVIGVKRKNIRVGVLLAVLYAINPLAILNSSAWGQIDSILTLIIAFYIILLYKKKIPAATLLFITGLLIKPQMLFFGPVLAVVFIKHLFEDGVKAGLKTFFISFGAGVGLFSIVVLPFAIGKEWNWILTKYMGTINSYPYATLNAANIFGFLKQNWQPMENTLMGLSMSTWGLIGVLSSIVVYFILSFINKNKGNLFINSVMLMTLLYTFGHKMHERYLFPVMAVILIGFMYQNRKETLFVYGLISTALFINVAQVLAITHIPKDDLLYRLSSLTIVISSIILIALCTVYTIKSVKTPEVSTEPYDEPLEQFDQDSLTE